MNSLEEAITTRTKATIAAILGERSREDFAELIAPVVETLTASLLDSLAKGEVDGATTRHLEAQLANLEATSALLSRRMILYAFEETIGLAMRGLLAAL